MTESFDEYEDCECSQCERSSLRSLSYFIDDVAMDDPELAKKLYKEHLYKEVPNG